MVWRTQRSSFGPARSSNGGAILCGHVHQTYRVRLPAIGPEVFCAGSATMHELEGFWMYEVEDGRLSARQGRWTGHGYEVDPE